VITDITEQRYLERKSRFGDPGPRQIRSETPELGEMRPFAEGVELTEKERPAPASRQSPEGLTRRERQVRNDRREQPSRRKICPEKHFGVSRHASLERGAVMVIARGNFV
jgi:hypothetical protein